MRTNPSKWISCIIKLFKAAEIANTSKEERLKYYGDIKNVVNLSKEEGRKERIEGKDIKDIQAIRAEMNRTKN